MLQKFRARTRMALKIMTLTDFCAFKTNLFSLCVKTRLWAAAAKGEHWANPWQGRRSEHGQTSNKAGHWLSSRGSHPALPSPARSTQLHSPAAPCVEKLTSTRGYFCPCSSQPFSLECSLGNGFFHLCYRKILPKHVLKRTLKAALPSKWFVLGYLMGLF